MEGNVMALFNNLIKRASKFVEKQKGVWDHSKWQSFLSDTQKKGVNMTEEKRKYLGSVMESMKKFYESSSETGKRMTGTVSDQTAKFIDKTKGKWEHLEWEKFVKDIQKKGVDITEDTKANLGGILESAKKFYVSLSPAMKKEKKEPEIIEKPGDIIESKVSKKTTPKKKTTTPKKEPAKKVASKKAKEIKATKTVKKAPPKKKTAKSATVKKPTVKVTAKAKGSLASKK
jgi:hypothetical protein